MYLVLFVRNQGTARSYLVIKSLGRIALERSRGADLRIEERDLVKGRSCTKPDFLLTS